MAEHKRPRDDVAAKLNKRSQQNREPSIFNIRPSDDIVLAIADYIADCINQTKSSPANVEIEAKLGIFVDKRSLQRINIGAETETILSKDEMSRYRFESNMSLSQHRDYNKMLNDLFTNTQNPEYKGERILYKHTFETDSLYDRCRVTTDQKTNKIVPNGVLKKERISDLNIHSPRRTLDYRISVNLEFSVPEEDIPNYKPRLVRNKDRLSYKHGGISFDLTQVQSVSEKDADLRHELELEFMDASTLSDELSKRNKNEPSQYMSMIESFVNNIRMMSLKARKL